jgi:hypothetical protein
MPIGAPLWRREQPSVPTIAPQQITSNLTGNLSFTGSQSRSVTKGISATLSFVGSLPKATHHALR